MIIILPLSHERMQAQRFPYITLGIILFNTFLFLITHHGIVPQSYQESWEREQELVGYYIRHPYLELPQESYAKLSREKQQLIDQWRQLDPYEAMEAANRNTAVTERMLQSRGSEQLIEREDEKALAQIHQQEQEVLNELARSFEESVEDRFYHKYGYIPSRGGVFTIFSSIFLHGGYLHLIGNMLFLWLSGCNIEDLWGRIIYPIFYLLGGVLATLAHGMMYPESVIPLVGASGAIAAVMGAFMIRMYNTKIHFVYFMLMFGAVRGRFSAPAYIMLPLWLLQQIWGAIRASSMGSDVAFWAHIGGFVFGAVVAGLFKLTRFETNVIAPTIEKKVAIVDEHLATGIEKLQENDVNGAIKELRAALQNNSNDPIAHSELSKAYFAAGNEKFALREFKRAIFLYMKRGEMDEAIAQYLELHAEMPEMMLDPPQQMKIAIALEQQARKENTRYSDEKEAHEKEQLMYRHASVAYRKIITHYQRQQRTLAHPDAIKALAHYADLNLYHLEHPQEAGKAYQMLLRSSNPPPQEKKSINEKIRQAQQTASAQAQAKKRQQAQKKVATTHTQQQPQKTTPKVTKPKRNIPLQQRIKLVPDGDAPSKYQVASVAPIEANKVLPAEEGLDLRRPADAPVLFQDIYVICVFQMKEEKPKPQQSRRKKKRGQGSTGFHFSEEIILADLFLAGKSRPYRIASNLISYPQFFTNLQSNSLANFRQFMLYIISNIDSVYVDQATMRFLKTGKPRMFLSKEDLALHEKIFWKQLKGAVRFQCEQCAEVYWIDGMKVPESGAKTQCAKCGQILFVRRTTSPQSSASLR